MHLATLRAHVRKIAEERKDKLGPNWTSWVGKAVRKLEEQGILQHVDSSGYIHMSSEGKKALSVARRQVFGSSTGYLSTPEKEEQVWRTVNEHFSPAPYLSGARRRHSSVSSGRKRRKSTLGGVSWEIGDEDEQRSISASPLIKRRRTTDLNSLAFATPVKPTSKMSKAELQARVKDLQARLDASQPGRSTDRSEAETKRLRKDLRESRMKLEAYRQQIEIFGEQYEELTDLEDDEVASTGVSSPSQESRVLTPPRPPMARSRSRLLAMGRTESGSLIHGVSGQPTPAPSDDEHWGMDQRHDAEYQVDEYDTGRECLQRGHDKPITTAFRDVMTSMEHRSAEKDREIENLMVQVAQRDSALSILPERETVITELQCAVASKDRAISELRTAVTARDRTISKMDRILSAILVMPSRPADGEGAKEAEGVASQSLDESGQVQPRRHNFERGIEQPCENELKAIVTDATDKANLIRERLKAIQSELDLALSRLQNIDGQNRQMEDLLQEMQQRASEKEQHIRMREESIADKDKEIADKSSAALEFEKETERLTTELNQTRMSMNTLKDHLLTSETKKADLEANLRSDIEAIRTEKDIAMESLSNLQSEKAILQERNDVLQQKVESIRADLRNAHSENAATKNTVLGLLCDNDKARSALDAEVRLSATTKEALDAAVSDAAKLRDQVHEAEMEMQQIRGELAVKQVELATEQTTTSMLHSDLTATRAELEGLKKKFTTTLQELEELKVAKKGNEERIIDLKGLFEKLKKTQAECMSEVENKLANV